MIFPYNAAMNAEHSVTISVGEVKKVAGLASLPITDAQAEKFGPQLTSVLGYVAKVQSLDTEGIEETSQVTGMENVFREDVVDSSRTFTQTEALQNAKKTHNGYFVVPAVFDN